MKIVFSTKNVSRASFLDTCRYAYDYGFEGFEIYDALGERSSHHDSILRRDRIADAKRKLVNRNLAVSALRMPAPIESDETTAELVQKYVDMAAASGVDNVIVRVEANVSFDVLDQKASAAIKRAEKADVNVLFETVGYLANTENVVAIINHFASAAVGASWNVRGTFFDAGETAETTIKNLGAYIKYVRLGDMKDGKTVLIGEGELDVKKLINALSSLNYEGFLCAAWNEEIQDADLELTHFANYVSTLGREKKTFVLSLNASACLVAIYTFALREGGTFISFLRARIALIAPITRFILSESASNTRESSNFGYSEIIMLSSE